MRRAALCSAAAVAVAALIASSGAVAAVPPRTSTATAQLNVFDGPGGVVAKQGTARDADGSIDGFKPGRGTVVTPTAADLAMDLISADYRIARTGRVPALKVTYRVAGTFSRSDSASQTSTTVTEVVSFDGVATYLDNGYMIQTENDGMPMDTGILSPRGKKVDCPGFRTTLKAGTSVATQSVPLSCLQRAHVTASRLQPVSAHLAVTVSATRAGTMSSIGEVATDAAAKTKRVRLTPLGR